MALSLGESDGFVKVVARASDKTLLGVHIMGPEAASVLGEAALAVSRKLTAGDVAHSVHAHPTLCECFRDACLRVLEKEK
jgi:dihydrolipoamide dehydrogenase